MRSPESHPITDFLHNAGTDARYGEQIIQLSKSAASVAKLHDPSGELGADSRQLNDVLKCGSI